MRVIGLDLSLSSTGIAGIEDGIGAWCERVRIPADGYPSQLRRIRKLRGWLGDYIGGRTDLVVVEGLAIGSQTGQHLTRAGMWHILIDYIDGRCPWAEVPPTTLKRYATGKGNAGKDEVLAAVIKRFPDVEVRGNDEADALVLAAMGADHLGKPIVDMPAAHRSALDKVRWPDA